MATFLDMLPFNINREALLKALRRDAEKQGEDTPAEPAVHYILGLDLQANPEAVLTALVQELSAAGDTIDQLRSALQSIGESTSQALLDQIISGGDLGGDPTPAFDALVAALDQAAQAARASIENLAALAAVLADVPALAGVLQQVAERLTMLTGLEGLVEALLDGEPDEGDVAAVVTAIETVLSATADTVAGKVMRIADGEGFETTTALIAQGGVVVEQLQALAEDGREGFAAAIGSVLAQAMEQLQAIAPDLQALINPEELTALIDGLLSELGALPTVLEAALDAVVDAVAPPPLDIPGLPGQPELPGAPAPEPAPLPLVQLPGSVGNDILRGTPQNESITGGDGDDRISTGGGNDAVNAGAGDDTITLVGRRELAKAGEGDSTIVYSPALDATLLDALRNDGNSTHTLDGGAGVDTLVVKGSLNFGGTLAHIETLKLEAETRDATVITPGALPTMRKEVFGTFTIASDALNQLGAASLSVAGTQDSTLEVTAEPGGVARLTALKLNTLGEVTLKVSGTAEAEETLDLGDLTAANTDNRTLRIVLDSTTTGVSTAEDAIRIAGSNLGIVIGSEFADEVVGGGRGDNLFGGAGNDTLRGNVGEDMLSGDEGDDILTGGDDRDILSGGAGADSLDGGNADDFLTGESGDDLLEGGAGSDTLSSGEGNDTLSGGHGDDHLFAGDGDNLLEGGEGNDLLTAGDGGSTLHGDAGDDLLMAGNGSNLLEGGAGADTLWGGLGADTLLGGEGDDLIQAAGFLGGLLDGGDGHDTLIGAGGQSTLLGGDGDDLLQGGGDNDSMVGGAGRDTLMASPGTDTLLGGDGDDTFIATTGFELTEGDSIDGGAGVNTLIFRPQTGDEHITLGTQSNIGASLLNIQKVIVERSAQANDLDLVNVDASRMTSGIEITGHGGRNLITGGSGNDRLSNGGGGQDTLAGGAGDDTIALSGPTSAIESVVADGGTGTNTLLLHPIDTSIPGSTITLSGTRLTAFDTIAVTLGTSDRTFTVDASTMGMGTPGRALTIDGNMPNETLIGSQSRANLISGHDGDDRLMGQGLADTLDGGAGADTLEGGAGNDILSGGAGNDLLTGGNGADVINGGADADTAIINLAGTDLAGDKINLGGDQGDRVQFSGSAMGQEVLVGFESAAIGNGTGTVRLVKQNVSQANTNTGIDLDSPSGVATLNNHSVTLSGATFHVVGTNGDGVAQAGQDRGSFAAVHLLSSGDDTLTTGNGTGTLGEYVNGGAGNDVITGGNNADFLVGGAGNDSLSGGAGNDSFIGGAGNDLLSGGEGSDLLNGGNGADTMNGGAGADTVIIDLTGTDPAGTDLAGDQINLGGDQGDRVQFSGLAVGQEVLVGFESAAIGNGTGAVRLVKRDASTPISANTDLDTLLGAATLNNHAVTLSGATFHVVGTNADGVAQAGQDRGSFAAVHLLSAGDDTLTTGNGAGTLGEYVNAGNGNDTITGGNNADFLVGGAGNDSLSGGAGNDSFIGGAGADTINGGTGIDTATISLAADDLKGDRLLLGGDAGDTVVFSGLASGQELVVGVNFNNASADLLLLKQASGTVKAEDNLKTTDGVAAVNGANIGLTNPGSAAASFRVVGVDSMGVVQTVTGLFSAVRLGSTGADTLIGGSSPEYLSGGTGADSIVGGSAADLLIGGDGNDTITGGAGSDTIFGGEGNDTIVINGTAQLASGEVIDGGNGTDRLLFNSSIDNETLTLNPAVLTSLEEFTVAAAAGARAHINGASMTSSLVITGHAGANNLSGGSAADTLNGGDGNDLLSGNAGNDSLDGGSGADQLRGGDGKDTLFGGAGSDILNGGRDADVFRFSGRFGDTDNGTLSIKDTVQDYLRSEKDILDFSAYRLDNNDTMASLATSLNMSADRNIPVISALQTSLSESLYSARVVEVDLGSLITVTDAMLPGQLLSTNAMGGGRFVEGNSTAGSFIVMVINGSAPVRIALIENPTASAGDAKVTLIGELSFVTKGGFTLGDFGI